MDASLDDCRSSEGLVYVSSLAVGWRALDVLPDTEHASRLNETNSLFLKALNALEEGSGDVLDAASGTAALQLELERLDMKLNLLIDLVSHVLGRQVGVPPHAEVRLGVHAITWYTSLPAPPEGAFVIVDVYITPLYPRPLELAGQVVSVRDGWASVAFANLGEDVSEGIQKLIFRHHRRAVATQRSAARTSTG